MKKTISLLVLIFLIPFQSFADVNVRTFPFQLVNLIVDIPVSRNWTLGPQLLYSSSEDDGYSVDARAFGLRANYWFNEDVFTQGWYLGPGISYASVEVEDDESGSELTGKASGLSLSVLGGYHWMWESFNIMLGIGPAYYSIGEVTIEDDFGNEESYAGYEGLGIALEFTLGWKF